MLLLANDLTDGYHKFYSYFSKGDNTHFFNTILKYVEKVYYILYLIMMAIGMVKMK